MNDLRMALDDLAGRLAPGPDAWERLRAFADRRSRRRRRVSAATAAGLVVALAASTVQGWSSGTQALTGSKASLALRHDLGIGGVTKGAPSSVLVHSTVHGHADTLLVQVRTGLSRRLPIGADGASVSPGDDVVAAAGEDGLTVVDSGAGRTTRPVPSDSGPSRGLSWGRGGAALFASVRGRWVLVSNPGRPGLEEVRTLEVPAIPGGPILLSVAPSGDRVLLFGIIPPTAEGDRPTPHLELGRFDGTAVTDLHPLDIPATALEGPMGWVGDNAFLVAPGTGRAVIVRTDGSRVGVQVRGIANPCLVLRGPPGCTAAGPNLMGTNDDGSLLFWKVSVRAVGPSHRYLRTLYYETWLDGTHTLRLTGVLGDVGPPVAAR